MSSPKKRNVGHSVFQRLLKYAKTNGEDFNLVLLRYGIERLLYRLGVSSYADAFILKGASLFLVWKGQNYRVTKDADLLGLGPADVDHLIAVFRGVCQITTEYDDGIIFMRDSVRATPIREGQVYDGIRITLLGRLHQARVPLQIDIGFGDAITPNPAPVRFPTLLDAPAPRIFAYTKYTMIAEKFHAMVTLGLANSRMKDFFDVWLLSRLFEFEGVLLSEAIHNTFTRRSTPLPEGRPFAFTNDFRKDARKQIR